MDLDAMLYVAKGKNFLHPQPYHTPVQRSVIHIPKMSLKWICNFLVILPGETNKPTNKGGGNHQIYKFKKLTNK